MIDSDSNNPPTVRFLFEYRSCLEVCDSMLYDPIVHSKSMIEKIIFQGVFKSGERAHNISILKQHMMLKVAMCNFQFGLILAATLDKSGSVFTLS